MSAPSRLPATHTLSHTGASRCWRVRGVPNGEGSDRKFRLSDSVGYCCCCFVARARTHTQRDTNTLSRADPTQRGEGAPCGSCFLDFGPTLSTEPARLAAGPRNSGSHAPFPFTQSHLDASPRHRTHTVSRMLPLRSFYLVYRASLAVRRTRRYRRTTRIVRPGRGHPVTGDSGGVRCYGSGCASMRARMVYTRARTHTGGILVVESEE